MPQTSATGICFKCGSASHTSKKCKAKVPEGQYPYAKCFICQEVGHLSSACPDNPKGLYPHGTYQSHPGFSPGILLREIGGLGLGGVCVHIKVELTVKAEWATLERGPGENAGSGKVGKEGHQTCPYYRRFATAKK